MACDADDLAIVSSMLQDAIVTAADMVFLKKEHAFVMAINRFRWEVPVVGSAGERVNAGVRFDHVIQVQFRNIDRGNRERFAAILSVEYESSLVMIRFSGNAVVRLKVSELNCILRDFGESWPTIWRPKHEVT